jgi:hypothetical protein
LVGAEYDYVNQNFLKNARTILTRVPGDEPALILLAKFDFASAILGAGVSAMGQQRSWSNAVAGTKSHG